MGYSPDFPIAIKRLVVEAGAEAEAEGGKAVNLSWFVPYNTATQPSQLAEMWEYHSGMPRAGI